MDDVYGRLYVGDDAGIDPVDNGVALWADITRIIADCAASHNVALTGIGFELCKVSAPLVTVYEGNLVRVYKNGSYVWQFVGGGYTVHLWRSGVHDELWRAILSAVAHKMASL